MEPFTRVTAIAVPFKIPDARGSVTVAPTTAVPRESIEVRALVFFRPDA